VPSVQRPHSAKLTTIIRSRLTMSASLPLKGMKIEYTQAKAVPVDARRIENHFRSVLLLCGGLLLIFLLMLVTQGCP
jgi:hypothetical protein